MLIARRLLIASIVLLVVACGSRKEAEQQAPMPVEDTVVGDMVGTMDRARGVEDTVMQQKQELDRELQESEGE